MVLDAQDISNYSLRSHFDETNEFIATGCSRGGVLVYCGAGVSRSSTVIIGYLLANHEELDYWKALQVVRQARPIVSPNDGFERQLMVNECFHSNKT